MKKIIPFNNVVNFNTDVKEITAISLEHEIKKYPDMISGAFYISGEYKITEGLLEKEKFNFELPFDIALTNNYELDTLLVDIDDFRYELISDKNLKVNIDLYIDGEEIQIPESRYTYNDELTKKTEEDFRNIIDKNYTNDLPEEIIKNKDEFEIDEQNLNILLEETEKNNIENENKKEYESIKEKINIKKDEKLQIPNKKNINESIEQVNLKSIEDESFKENNDITPERIDLLKDMLTNNSDKENDMNKDINLNINNNEINNPTELETEQTTNNLFTPSNEEKYVTYRVYKITETDTIDTILTKYNITKEMLADYNNIENINPGDKLIIPTNEK